MFAESIPKINLGLGLVVIVCFFLPWVSIDRGNVSFVKISGYNLTTGNIPLDERSLAALGDRLGGGKLTTNQTITPVQKGHPQYYLIFVVIAALGVVLYSIQGMRRYSRVKTLSVGVFGALGLLGIIVSALLDFGLAIPAEAATMIQTTYQVGFYGSVLSFLGVIVFSFLLMKSAHDVTAEPLSAELKNLVVETPPPVAMDDVPFDAEAAPAPETPAPEPPPSDSPFPDLTSFGEPAMKAEPAGQKPPDAEKDSENKASSGKKEQIKLPLVAPEAKACPTCGAAVGQFQSKCIRCGTKLKPVR